MIEVLGFYAKGAQVARVTHEFDPTTFGSTKVLHELGHSPKGDESPTKKAKAHLLTVDGDKVLVLNAGHDYVVKHSAKGNKDLKISAKGGHQVVSPLGKIDKVLVGEDEIEVIS